MSTIFHTPEELQNQVDILTLENINLLQKVNDLQKKNAQLKRLVGIYFQLIGMSIK